MEDNERTEVINEFEVEEVSGNSGSILKPLLAVVGLAAAGIGGFIFYKKRKKSKLIELPFDDKKEQDDNDDEKQKDEE